MKSRAWLREWAPAGLPAAAAAVFSTITYFFPGVHASYGMQAGLAAGIGWRITAGDTLYTEIWENKGPLYYLINALGVSINYWHGIWVLEFAALVGSALVMYRLARMALTPWLAGVAATAALASLAGTLMVGNLVEEWAMPFLAVSVWATFKTTLDQGGHPVRRGVALGLAIGALLAMRPNLAAFACVAALGVAWYLVKRGTWRPLWLLSGSAIVSCCALLGALAIWLASQGALAACLESAYFDVVHWDYSLAERLANAGVMLSGLRPGGGLVILALFLAGAAALVIRRVNYAWAGRDPRPVRLMAPQRYLVMVTAVGLVANLAANLISGNPDPNYMMTFVPLLAWPAAWLMTKCIRALEARLKPRPVAARLVTAAMAVVLAATAATPALGKGSPSLWGATDHNSRVRDLAAFMRRETSPEARVALVELPETAHYVAQRRPATVRFYRPMPPFEESFKREWNDGIAQDLLDGGATLIIFDSPDLAESWLDNAISPEIGERLRAMLAGDYFLVPNERGWAAYKRR
ncbi:MAG: hypothetical protein LBJ02_04095 [Bifidobacteriaceae bacterium]|jgi:hypothetical protein|nr:hypothetical protein [Bifidobacteriaceae bacterium]